VLLFLGLLADSLASADLLLQAVVIPIAAAAGVAEGEGRVPAQRLLSANQQSPNLMLFHLDV
jgi:hypothetical protein